MSELLLRLFVKNRTDTANPVVRTSYGKLAGCVGIACNVLLGIVKMLLGYLFGAVSMVADGANNLTDASGSVITLLGFRLSAKPADEKHPYGYARYEYLSALGVSVLILVIGLELVLSSFEKILSYFSDAPEGATTEHLILVIVALVLSILAKLWLMLFYKKLGKAIDSKALLASGADSRNDVVATIAVLGAYLLEAFTGWFVDGYVGIAVAAFIIYSGFELAKDTISPLLGEGASPELAEMIAEKILKNDMILGVHDLFVHDYGPGRQFASVHVEIDQAENVLDAHELIDNIEYEFFTQHHIALVIHYDPIVTDDPELNHLRQLLHDYLPKLNQRLRIHDLRMTQGHKHSNVLFDLELPFELESHKEEFCTKLRELLQTENSKYHVKITVDMTNL